MAKAARDATEDVVGKTIASAEYTDQDRWTELRVVFTDGTTWTISTCTCCGLADDLKAVAPA